MLEFIETYNLTGLAVGLATFLIIGLFHPLVVKAEYYIGTRSWILFLILGIAAGVISLLITDILISVIAGVFSFSSLWSIREVFEQAERVRKGWFPPNPRRRR